MKTSSSKKSKLVEVLFDILLELVPLALVAVGAALLHLPGTEIFLRQMEITFNWSLVQLAKAQIWLLQQPESTELLISVGGLLLAGFLVVLVSFPKTVWQYLNRLRGYTRE